MHYKDDNEQKRYEANKAKNIFEKHSEPSASKIKQVRFEEPLKESTSTGDIVVLRDQIAANACYVFPTVAAKHREDHNSKNATEIFDMIVSKRKNLYRSLFFVRGDKAPCIVGGYAPSVEAALAGLVDVTCERVTRELDALALKGKW